MKKNPAFINEFDLRPEFLNFLQKGTSNLTVEKIPAGDLSFQVHTLFTPKEVARFCKELTQQTWIPVGIDGIQKHYQPGDPIGSYRLSCYEEDLAKLIWRRICVFFPKIRQMNPNTPSDWDGHELWEPFGINPLFRLIRYEGGGWLVPHYDASFIQNEENKSLSSLVIYLTENQNGGATRFLYDSQTELPLSQRNYQDWNRKASETDIWFQVEPKAGDALIFDHRILHDSEPLQSKEEKIIIRTDILYRKVRQ